MNYLSAVKYIAILATVVILVGCGWIARGWKDSRDVLQQKVQSVNEAGEITTNAQDAVSVIDSNGTKEIADVQKTLDGINARLSDGSLRFTCKGGVPKTPGNTGMDNGDKGAYLDPEINRNLVGITGEGDKAIVQLKACQQYVLSLKQNGFQ